MGREFDSADRKWKCQLHVDPFLLRAEGMDEVRVRLLFASCKDTQELAPSLPKETRIGFDLLSKGLNERFLYKDAKNDVQSVLIALALLRQSRKRLSGNCDEVEAPCPGSLLILPGSNAGSGT